MGKGMDFLRSKTDFFRSRIKGVLLTPALIFRTVKEEKITVTLVFFTILSLLFTALYPINYMYCYRLGLPAPSTSFKTLLEPIVPSLYLEPPLYFLAYAYMVDFLLPLLIYPLFTLWINLLIRLIGYGDDMRFTLTLKAMLYGATPQIILGWLPFIAFLGFLWSLYVTIVGLRELHKMTNVQALIILLVSGFTFFIVLGIVIVFGIVATGLLIALLLIFIVCIVCSHFEDEVP